MAAEGCPDQGREDSTLRRGALECRINWGEHTPLSKLNRKMEDARSRVHEEGSDSSVDDNVPINQSLKLPHVAQLSSSGKSVAKDKSIIKQDKGSFEGTDRSLGPDMEVQPVVKKYEEDNNVRYLVHRCRVLMEGFLVVPVINQLAPEATIQEQSPRVATAVTSAFDKCINVLPIGDLSTLFQAHDATMELTNMDSAEVFTDIQNDSLISLGTSQAGYVAGDFGERSSLVAGEPILQQ
ncbi:hypothetical protein RHSIM_Rhsim01G0163600 [Rhododendron simsii]|uniref:Uncharacterized protein n=1 Tax=Rhododendron simsii TaxID=118357 RepID=A0A834HCW5_RHOSS|nr:hypothetical protein RHSIM_Rhsim01G0163600 [Rhododendron simsii]